MERKIPDGTIRLNHFRDIGDNQTSGAERIFEICDGLLTVNKIFVGGLRQEVQETELREYFENFGESRKLTSWWTGIPTQCVDLHLSNLMISIL
ncbi:hypothetical protein CEXT_318561 [Caerostris extrusa]|uniref:RRM domain-containing protein n=1 Tax=Caerostris extrusa TaxID=172846 RepID=A0AAV4VZS7_CAEEX|nr:hypothetical protein CEXT_318561 [Caerostris extrusa]